MLRQVMVGVHRQMLHAWQMTFAHPDTGTPVFIEAPLAPDMAWAIRQLHAIAI